MNDMIKTGIFVGVAAILGGLALYTGGPVQTDLAQFSDQGEAFYASFTDPLRAASLEVIDYDEASGTATPFKVQVTDGRWSIPSHYDYPADGEERLATTAASIIDLTKDVVQSDRLQDHEKLGVLDPLGASITSLTGRGQRVTLRDAADAVLADFIIGDAVEGKNGFRYVRLPDKKRTYAVKMDIDVSTKFADWIETNLFEVNAYDIKRVTIRDYSFDEATGQVINQGSIKLDKIDSTWTMTDLPAGKEVQAGTVSTMTNALAGLTITGVRPKPAGLTGDLRTEAGINMDLPTQLSLQSKGYFVSRDGRLISNEGEVIVGTTEGVSYVMRFGEILIGEGLAVSAGGDSEGQDTTGENGAEGVENRYLFVTAQFDETLLDPRPVPPEGYTPAPTNVDPSSEAPPRDPAFLQYDQDLILWTQKYDEGQTKARQLNDRFAAWYYVISAGDFDSIRPGQESLLMDATPSEDAPESIPAMPILPPPPDGP